MLLAKIYARFYVLMQTRFGLAPRGLGWFLRRLKKDALLEVEGFMVYMKAGLASSYARLIVGRWNEVETHKFMHMLAQRLDGIAFFDVGANIGEMVIDFATLPTVKHVVAFEPDPGCARVIEINVLLNESPHVVVENVAVGETAAMAFLVDGGTPQASLVFSGQSTDAVEVGVVTLDTYLEKNFKTVLQQGTQAVFLIDVEGAEMGVLRGAQGAILEHQPLIIFEFNVISRQYFTLDDVRGVVGEGYDIFRLNQDGLLDKNLGVTWNCVAVPRHLIPLLGDDVFV